MLGDATVHLHVEMCLVQNSSLSPHEDLFVVLLILEHLKFIHLRYHFAAW